MNCLSKQEEEGDGNENSIVENSKNNVFMTIVRILYSLFFIIGAICIICGIILVFIYIFIFNPIASTIYVICLLILICFRLILIYCDKKPHSLGATSGFIIFICISFLIFFISIKG